MRSVAVLPADQLGSADRGAWRELQRSSPLFANPFLGPEFASAVARRKGRVHVAVLRDGTDRVGFLPFERGPIGIGRAIGIGISDCQALVHRSGLSWEPEALLRSCGLSVLEFDHLAGEHLDDGRHPFAPYVVDRYGSPVIDVGRGFAAYTERVRANSSSFLRTTLARGLKLEREFGDLRFVFDSADPAALRALMGWKSAQYRRTGRRDRFAQSWIAGVVRDLAGARSPGLTGTLSVLYAGGKPVAAHLGLRSERILTYWFPAYDTAYARFSPGLVLLLRMAEGAAAQGIELIDLGRGEARYKDSMKTGDLTVAEAVVSRPSAGLLLHRLRHEPARRAHGFVRRRPELAAFAARALARAGSLRRG